MDPVSLVVAAVVAGSSAAVKDAANDALKGAYQRLKALLQRKFEGDQAAEHALAKLEGDPDTERESFEEQLRRAPELDVELIQAAKELLARADLEDSVTGKYNVRITGSRGIVVGDGTHINMTFNGD